ncbi:MAG TPA: 2TM domain-containing protein [Flavitalea sp.]|nr:2TM domain-containing protein [Flavitalea sp.]
MDHQNLNIPQGRDPQLWQIAKRRASFRYHLFVYVIVNLFLWSIWYFGNDQGNQSDYPWPVWSTMGWGIGILFHFLGAYVFPKENSVEREYNRLLKKNNKL